MNTLSLANLPTWDRHTRTLLAAIGGLLALATLAPGCTNPTDDSSKDTACTGAECDDQDADGDGYDVDVDCDDTNADVWPGAPDAWYDGVDSDCAGNDDDDADADGVGVDTDCNDSDATMYPGAPDAWYDGIDSDCAGNNDYDADADGFELDADCDDVDATIYPGAPETWYDGVDSNCGGDNDYDADGDGFELGFDCDDNNALDFPDENGLCDSTGPTVVASSPDDGDTNVGIGGPIYVYFDEEVDPLTVTIDTFTLSTGGVAVPGLVVATGDTATFTQTASLSGSTVYTAELTTDVSDLAGNAMSVPYTWSFTTERATASVELGSAGDFAILAKTGVSNVPTSAVTGDIGLSPAAASFLTGFSLTADASNVFATSDQVTGSVYAADYAEPTPTMLTTAVADMELAFTDASGRAPDVTELGAGDIGGMTLAPGVYKWGTGLLIPTNVTLDGSATGVWIFEIAQDLTVASAASVILAGGALPQNITWQVAGLVDVGTTAHLEGVVLCQTGISLGTGATVNGRLLAQTAVTLDGSTVVEPTE